MTPSIETALVTIMQALNIGRDNTRNIAIHYHEAMRGYRADEHMAVDEEEELIECGIKMAQWLSNELIGNRNPRRPLDLPDELREQPDMQGFLRKMGMI